jgi:hypothetical protein
MHASLVAYYATGLRAPWPQALIGCTVWLGLNLGECHRVVIGGKEYAGALKATCNPKSPAVYISGSNKAPRTVRNC